MCLEVLNYQEKFMVDEFFRLRHTNKGTRDASRFYKTLSKIKLMYLEVKLQQASCS